MNNLKNLEPGTRKNAFYIKSDFVDYDRIGFQSSHNQEIYLHQWDEKEQKYVGRWVEKNRYDDL